VLHRHLTFDMRGVTRLAGARPLDGRVRPQAHSSSEGLSLSCQETVPSVCPPHSITTVHSLSGSPAGRSVLIRSARPRRKCERTDPVRGSLSRTHMSRSSARQSYEWHSESTEPAVPTRSARLKRTISSIGWRSA
jgi:hypothetical protein